MCCRAVDAISCNKRLRLHNIMLHTAGPIPLLDRVQRVGPAIPAARHTVLLAVQLRSDHRLLALFWWVTARIAIAARTALEEA